ncbi:MAG: DUF4249 domain-containing protein [Bacteroidota bacterium]
MNYLYITAMFFLIITGCVTQFIPETDEQESSLVVEGLITDQPGIYTVKLAKSVPLAANISKEMLTGCTVIISDNLNNQVRLAETSPGVYTTRENEFRGQTGRIYRLQIETNSPELLNKTYESLPMEMNPVPVIDTIYYKKLDTETDDEGKVLKQACQVYLNTFDKSGSCEFYRWDFSETWMFRLPYDVQNQICWITKPSRSILIKTTSVLSENRIEKMPVNYITGETDRLSEKYSININQYSLNEDEFNYWERLRNVSENVGGLYDITPVSIPGNIYCNEDPYEQVLGYFSVSAVSSKRLFIKDGFEGVAHLYGECPADTIYGDEAIPGLGETTWIIINSSFSRPPFKVTTNYERCADCTISGTNVEPLFWREDNQ